MHGQAIWLTESCPKNGDLPKSPLIKIGSLMPSVGTKLFSKIDVGLNCGGRWHTHNCYRALPAAFALFENEQGERYENTHRIP
jgi:hypothetical protein